MRDLMEQFATQYVMDLEAQLDSGNGQRSIQNPVLFLIVGDKSREALRAVCAINESKWDNSQGVLYVHAYTQETWEHPLVHGCRLPEPDADKKTMRASIHERFWQDESAHLELNRVMKLASIRAAEMGKLFSSVQQVNIAVVTRADDPANVLLPELTLLLKSYLAELFKNVFVDLYVLLQEKNSGGEFGFSAALGVSFLEELDTYQRSDYQFRADLLVTEDRIKLPVEHARGPLFSLAFLLGEKNEQGMFLDHAVEENCELISNIVLLNNKSAEIRYSENNEGYNKLQFIRSITGDAGQPAYASAGLSKVKRPTQAIALTVLSAVFDYYWERLKEGAVPEKTRAREMLGLTSHELQRISRSVLPDGSVLDEMAGLMTAKVSYSELAALTLREAEQALFLGSSQTFFEANFVQGARKRLENLQIKESLAGLIRQEIIDDERFGLYAAYQLTAGDGEASLLGEIHTGIKEAMRQLEQAKAELEDIYQQRVDRQAIKVGGFFTRDKERVRALVRHLFSLVYGKKTEILEWELTLQLLVECEAQVKEMHRQIGARVEQLEGLQKELREISRKSIREASDYLGKNIDEHYRSVVRETMHALEAQRGAGFYGDARYIGSGSLLLQNGIEGLMERLCRFCRTEMLMRPAFSLSFEEELLARAHAASAYENMSVLTRDELFADIAMALEERAAIHIEVFHFLQKHRYEEKYLFADIRNDFVQYVLGSEAGTRTCKLGCIHEERKSGIEKMNLMGGFGIKDLMYYRNNQKYHSSYRENGFVFHRLGKGGSS